MTSDEGLPARPREGPRSVPNLSLTRAKRLQTVQAVMYKC
nr:MAG TPA: hypothetical protein [Caudoviricetes sp.]